MVETSAPDIGDVRGAARGYAWEDDRGAGFDREEEKVEDVAADFSDADVRIVEVEEQVRVPLCLVALAS